MDAQDCINAISEGMDRIRSEESEHVVIEKGPLHISRRDMSEIVGKPLGNLHYKDIARLIIAMRDNKKIIIPRHYQKTDNLTIATILNNILPEKIIFTELED